MSFPLKWRAKDAESVYVVAENCCLNPSKLHHGKEDGEPRGLASQCLVERGQEGHLRPGAEDAHPVV